MVPGYEHFGVLVERADEVTAIWTLVGSLGVARDPLDAPIGGTTSFQFRHLLPMAIEVQHFGPRPP